MKHRLYPIEWITILYIIFTALLVMVNADRMAPGAAAGMLSVRVVVLVIMGIIYATYCWRPVRATDFLRYFYPMTLTSLWYPETYEFSKLLTNLDHVFASAEQSLFGCQPAWEFAHHCNSTLASELMFMGYFSYYPMIFVSFLVPWFADKAYFSRTTFTVLGSFLLCYIIYLFLPVAGPQFYFPVIGEQAVVTGSFEPVGDWFRTHSALTSAGYPDGIFHTLMGYIHEGERPTAAFPSSHVGVSTVIMLCLWQHRRQRLWFWCLLPFWILLCLSTVYIQAHYLIDAIAGLFAGIAMYAALWYVYPRLSRISRKS